jgi:hypothetical protein
MRKIVFNRRRLIFFWGIATCAFLAGIIVWHGYTLILLRQTSIIKKYETAKELGPVIEEYETSNSSFKIRAQLRQELKFLPGSYIKFQSAVINENSWQDILTVYDEDSNPIPREQMRFINENVGYFFIRSFHAVTTNKGQTWTIYDLSKEASYKCSFMLIDEVKMNADGTGEMIVYAHDDEKKNIPKIHTSDFGQRWTVEKTLLPCP